MSQYKRGIRHPLASVAEQILKSVFAERGINHVLTLKLGCEK